MSLISIVMATYNRASTLSRAIDSVIAQTYPIWELIVVDDGSTDNTQALLARYSDPRIKTLQHQPNRGVAAARNRGLDLMKGQWFTLLDSDDELLPHALSTLIQVPRETDPRIDAVTCNCTDSMTGEFSGKGLEKSQYVSYDMMVSKLSGEHWGLTKTASLGKARFNESISGAESVLWYKINQGVCRYYIHQALRIYHTEGDDRLSKRSRKTNIDAKCAYYRELAKETEYLETLREYRAAHYGAIMSRIALTHILEHRMRQAQLAIHEARNYWSIPRRIAVRVAQTLGPGGTRRILTILR